MLISTAERLDLLASAGREIRALHGSVPPASFYQRKLAACLGRARDSRAYRHLADGVDFGEVPVTTKDALKTAPWDFVVESTGQDSGVAKYYETTGSTGVVTPTPRRVADIIWNVVSVAEAWQDVLAPDDGPTGRVAVLLPSDVVPVADLVTGVCEFLNLPHTRAYPFATGICDWDRLFELWHTFRPNVVFVAPGVALQLTRTAKRRGLLDQLRASVRDIMLLGEVSSPALRDRLGGWWHANAYDASYGSTETGTLAACCRRGNLHLLCATNYFELDTGSGIVPMPDSGSGSLVVTPLNLHARPLLRLDTGDDVRIGGRCDCANAAPVVTVEGRGRDVVTVRGAALTTRSVETIVYSTTEATGYLIEIDPSGKYARLLLERDVDAERAAERAAIDTLQAVSEHELGLSWDDVAFVNTLPATTKSGGSQKSWKRSNIRTVGVSR
jgi:phenylacetate-CoA ligase